LTLPEHEDLVVLEEPGHTMIAFGRADPGLDLDALVALATAVDALLSAGLTDQARPIVRELRSALEAAQGPRARVIDLSVERAKRSD
jgi:hypothetical protein